MIKTRDLRPCDQCGSPIAPMFYRIELHLQTMFLDSSAINEVLGATQILGSLALGELMSPNRDAAIELPDASITQELFICQECITGINGSPFTITPVKLLGQLEDKE